MRDRVVARLQLETELRRAIERQEFRIQYQPIVSLVTGRVVGFEALLRWQHPERGLVYPPEFMPLAEEIGLSIPIDQWVLQQACYQIQQWQQRFLLDSSMREELPERNEDNTGDRQFLTINVNLGNSQFRQSELPRYIHQILQENNLDASSLQLEITENVIMHNDTATAMLLQLRDLGIQLLIDDFGTGYSSLGRLHRFPINMLKIDRSFVSNIEASQVSLEIIETIITLAQKLGVDATAEGVETAEQLHQLRELNCGYGQGYFFSPPLDAEAVETLMLAAPQW